MTWRGSWSLPARFPSFSRSFSYMDLETQGEFVGKGCFLGRWAVPSGQGWRRPPSHTAPSLSLLPQAQLG